MIYKLLTLLFIITLYSNNVYADNAILVGDLGIIKTPNMRGVYISTPYVREEPVVIIPTSSVDGVLEVKTYIEYNGEIQTTESMNNAGFFSIVTSQDVVNAS